jgi:hypothetical protein
MELLALRDDGLSWMRLRFVPRVPEEQADSPRKDSEPWDRGGPRLEKKRNLHWAAEGVIWTLNLKFFKRRMR